MFNAAPPLLEHVADLVVRVAAPTVRGHLRHSLSQLKRLVEYEQLRERAAARRAARSAQR